MEKPGGETVLGWAGMGARVRWAAVRDKTREPGNHELCVLRTVWRGNQRRIWRFRKVKWGWVRGKEQDRKPRSYTLIVQASNSTSSLRNG